MIEMKPQQLNLLSFSITYIGYNIFYCYNYCALNMIINDRLLLFIIMHFYNYVLIVNDNINK